MEVSITEFAKRVGKSPRAVHLRLKKGTLHREPSGKIDLERGLEEWRRNTRPRKDSDTEGDLDYNKARAKREKYLAELARLKVEQEKGRLIDVELVKRVIAGAMAILNARLGGVPEQLGPLVSSETDILRNVQTIRQALRAAMDDAASEFSNRGLNASDS